MQAYSSCSRWLGGLAALGSVALFAGPAAAQVRDQVEDGNAARTDAIFGAARPWTGANVTSTRSRRRSG